MPSRDPGARLEDILEAIARIERFTAGMDLVLFAGNEQAVYAVKYALLTISEAAAKLGDAAAELCPDISWRDLRGLGNRLRHDYDAIDDVRIWFLIERDIPVLEAAAQTALDRLDR